MSSNQNRRIEVILENPNPLFKSWLEKWLKEAETRDLKSKYKLKTALDALNSFPLPLATGRECAILRGFGKNLCALIDKKLDDYKKDNLEEFNKSINYDVGVRKVVKKVTKKKEVTRLPLAKSKVENADVADVENEGETLSVEDEQILMSPGEFDIILLVDTQETAGKSKQKENDETRLYLDSHDIPYEVRRLGVGDFIWIARNSSNKELVLPYIVERKRMDDFGSSIRDGRFHEQKYRLRDSGIQNLIYLIESYGKNQHVGLPMTTLMQAATNTQIHSKFQIKFTDSHRDSMLYLSVLTNIFRKLFKEKALLCVSKANLQPSNPESLVIGLLKFQEFQESSWKNKSVGIREIFIKQLLQLKSLSIDKALAITQVYPTPRALLIAYKSCATEEEAENLLSRITSGKLKRPVGSYISKVIYQFYNTDF